MAEGTYPSSQGCPSNSFHGLLIQNLVFTNVKLGKGSDATVFQVDWNGTLCAAKHLHDILLEDQSPGGVAKLIGNFEAECLMWSKLRHPGVVQFLGVYFERNSRIPALVMEKMDISLRAYLEDHSKNEFPLNLKAFVLRQVTQALAYLHSQNPPLVHHDLSPNNVLLNVVSFVTKVSDFGMSRAINPSSLSRKSSIKGTLAFMAPEALRDPPQYNEKLDVFSFGNIILSTLTHEWPNPGPPKQYDGDQLIALTELQSRDRYVAMFTSQEKQLFLPAVNQCLQDQPSKRPSSVMLVRELRHIESSLPTGSHVPAPIEHLRQQLSAKEEERRQKDEALRQKDEALRKKMEELKEEDELFREALKEKERVMRERDATLRERDVALRETEAELQRLRNAMKERDNSTPVMRRQLTAAQKDVARLEAELEDMSGTQELAVRELTQHKKDGMEKSLRIAELEDALQRAMEEHRRMEGEIMTIEERTDRKIHDKNGEITILRDQLKEMEEVLDQERKEVVHLREGLRLRQGSLDMQQRQQQQQQQHQGQQVPQYHMPHPPTPIRYPNQGYCPPQRPTRTPAQPTASPAPVPAPTPEDMSGTQELAVRELIQLKEEGREKSLRISELEDALQRAMEEHRRMEGEIMTIEERTDRKIHDKNGEITILRDQLKEMEEVLDQERKEVVHLQEGLRLRQGSLDMQQRQQQQQHQGQQRANEGQCPICHKVFPSSQLQGHVNSHFDN